MISNYHHQFQAVINQLEKELTKLRASRATPSIVEDIAIEVYGGTRMLLKELSSISIPEPRTIVIKPWDKNIIKDIEKGLIKSELEFNPIVESELLRIQLPELTGETRQRLAKKLHGILEENRIKLRTIRDEVKREIEKKTANSEIRKDDRYDFIEELNEITREFTDKIDELGKKKEQEIMTI